jgi:hypothetical protein
MLSAIILSGCYCESHFAECHYAKCRYIECHGATVSTEFVRIRAYLPFSCGNSSETTDIKQKQSAQRLLKAKKDRKVSCC